MKDNKCGCEDIKQDKNEEKKKNDIGCGCGEETIKVPEEDCECGCSEEITESQEDTGCGCGTENVEASADSSCGCGSIDYPDLSRVENPDKPKFSADDEFIKEFENYAHSLGISSVGYTLLTSELIIKDKFVQYPFTIVLNIEMSKDILETPPGADAKDLNDTAYVKLAILTTKLSDYLRKNGFSTEIAHPFGGLVNFSALGQEAGIGYIGESGLLISPELGPRQKISAIFTSISNLPLNEENENAWIPYYCDKCGKCVKACPEKALVEKETCCGSEVELIQKKCIGCSQGCTYCIEACPFEEKGYEHVKNKFEKMNAKLKEKQEKKFKVELWNNWTKQNSNMFDELLNGSTMVFIMTENKEKLIFLEKGNNGFYISIKPLKELENSNADLLFVVDEKDMGDLLKDDGPSKFVDLLSSGKIEVFGLIDHSNLIDKGYMAFLNKLGLSLGGGSCCG